ncbi:MAG: hypothetical protein ABFS02_09230 [Pseudomonadota bacterium]
MSTSIPTLSRMGIVALAALMAATRFHHFGSPFALPDASLAVFFLAGLLIANPWFFWVLLLEGGFIDYLAISVGGVSDWCVTPAYLFLLPTYGAMWLGGRRAVRFDGRSARSLAAMGGLLIVSSSVAFLISNGSFYLLSGRYDGIRAADYLARIADYYLPYVSASVLYSALAYATVAVLRQLSRDSVRKLAH